MLCDVLHAGVEPIVLTGAIRPSSAPGADGPANLLAAVAVAGAAAAEGLGALVVFAGEVHAARAVRKVASLSPAAFGSPLTGPLGTVAEGRVRIAARPLRPAALALPDALGARVPIVPTYLGDDGAGLRGALRDGADAIVFVALGAGHVAPPVLAALREAAAAGAGGADAQARARRACPRDLRLRGSRGRSARQRGAARRRAVAAGGAHGPARGARRRRGPGHARARARCPARSGSAPSSGRSHSDSSGGPAVYPHRAVERNRAESHPLQNRRE